MAAFHISLLILAVIGVFAPEPIPKWLGPVACAAILIVFGDSTSQELHHIVAPLLAPLAFLLLAVPLAIMLDRLGFFEALATRLEPKRDPRLGLWILAAGVTTLLNLDASVVLLTPLYIRIARQQGINATSLAFIPVLLACLASSALPVSNLTNLIAAQQLHAGVVDFVVRLGPASLVATIIGWFAYRRVFRRQTATAPADTPVNRRALWLGTPIAAFVTVGFTLGGVVNIPPWAFALIADVVLLLLTRTIKATDFPVGAAALALGLGIVAGTAAPHLGISHLFAGDNWLGQLRVTGIALVGANTINNLPALLVSLPALGRHKDLVWAVLFGVNFGPTLILHGALAGLLWRNTASQLGVQITPLEYSKVGFRVGLPALLGGLVVLLVGRIV